MRSSPLRLSLVLCLLAVGACAAPQPTPAPAAPAKSVPLLFATENDGIQYYNEAGQVARQYPAEMARDVSLLPNGNILFAYINHYDSKREDNPSGIKEITPEGKTVFLFETTGQVFSCARLPNGLTLVGAASQGRVLLVDPKGTVTQSFQVKNTPGHSCMRHVRATPTGTILVAEESAKKVREYSQDGALLREISAPFPTFSALRLANGNTLVSGKTGILEVDPQGQTVWEFKAADFPELGVRYLAGFDVLENGDLLVCNAGGTPPFSA